MVKTSKLSRVSTKEAGRNLGVTLRKNGIHRNPDISVEVMPKVKEAEIDELQAQGHIEEDTRIEHYDRASAFMIGTANELGPKQVGVALAIAETLANLRELDSARVNVMGTYHHGDYSDYVEDTILLVRQ